MKNGLIISSISMAMLSACSAKLEIYDQNGNTLKGIPIRSPVLVEVTTTTSYIQDPAINQADPRWQYRDTIRELCNPTTATVTSSLPLGALNYVNYDPASFAKSEFKVEFNDAGGTKSISVNSDPAATTESVSSLLGTVLPFVKEPKAAPAAALGPGGIDLEELRKSACIVKGTAVTSIKEVKLP